MRLAPILFADLREVPMDAKQVIREALDQAKTTSEILLGGLSDAEMLTRAVPGMNHPAWQLGHLVASEKWMVEQVKPNSMPALPPGFEDRYSPKNAQSEDTTGWLDKATLLDLAAQQRAGTLKVLEQLTDAELQKPGPEMLRAIAPTNSATLLLVASHWSNHSGQWTAVRRLLGKPIAF
jgi:hypothetical protein